MDTTKYVSPAHCVIHVSTKEEEQGYNRGNLGCRDRVLVGCREGSTFISCLNLGYCCIFVRIIPLYMLLYTLSQCYHNMWLLDIYLAPLTLKTHP